MECNRIISTSTRTQQLLLNTTKAHAMLEKMAELGTKAYAMNFIFFIIGAAERRRLFNNFTFSVENVMI